VTASKLRIAFVSDVIYPYAKGGKEKRLHGVAKNLAASGLDVHIYTMKWWDGPKTIIRDGFMLHAISRKHDLYKDGRRSMAEAIFFGLAAFRLLFEPFDVADVDSMPFFPLLSMRVVCWIRGKHMYATWHEVTTLESWRSYTGRFAGTIGWAIERLSMTAPNTIFSNSPHTTARLHEIGVKQPINTITPGINVESIYQTKPKNVKNDVVFVGRLVDHKNADLLIQAIAQVKKDTPSISCTIVGDGPEKANLNNLIKKLGLQKNVHMVGIIEADTDLYSLLKASKMFVLPSIREGFSIVSIEANAAGIPVITTNHPDNAARDLITEGVNGYLVDPTAPAIAAKIRQILRHPGELHPRTAVAQYDWALVASQIKHALTV
jgi:glycosyltransferase involved in cell wall biosynthesis